MVNWASSTLEQRYARIDIRIDEAMASLAPVGSNRGPASSLVFGSTQAKNASQHPTNEDDSHPGHRLNERTCTSGRAVTAVASLQRGSTDAKAPASVAMAAVGPNLDAPAAR